MADLLNRPAAATTATTSGARGGSPAGAAGPAMATGASAPSVGETVRGLERRGLDHAEAGNLAALAFGVWPARTGWTVAQIEHLRFLRAIVRGGALEP